jgi:hypothetical protein
VGSFGSGLIVDGADLLIPTVSFIKSSDRHLTIRDCYLEKQTGAPLSGAVFDIGHVYATHILGNRLEVPGRYCPRFMTVSGEGSSFVFERNTHADLPWGSVTWNDDNSARYWINAWVRQRIVVRDNFQDISVPFNTVDAGSPRNEHDDLWVLTPGSRGLMNSDYALRLRVRNGAFVLPALPRFGSLIKFIDSERPVSGPVDIFVLAKGTRPGQGLNVQAQNSGGTAVVSRLSLTTDFRWHDVTRGSSYANLEIFAFNDDDNSGGEAHIKMIVVRRAAAPDSSV